MKKWKSCWGTAYFFSKITCENKAENIQRHFKTTLFRFGVQFYEFKVCRIINSFGRKCLDFWKCDYLFNMYWASTMGGCWKRCHGECEEAHREFRVSETGIHFATAPNVPCMVFFSNSYACLWNFLFILPASHCPLWAASALPHLDLTCMKRYSLRFHCI